MRPTRTFLSLSLLILYGAVAAGAQAPAPAKAPPRKAAAPTATVRPPRVIVRSHALPNGLRMFLVEDHSAPVVNLQVWYHVGSKDERPGRTGFAHLFEHMMFKGSTNVPPETHSRIVEAAGGFDNAYTSDDVTVYWQTFPSNYLERMLWLEADRMGGLQIDLDNFKSEREVVKEERRTGVDNPPYGKVVEDLYEAAFDVHPYKHTTIGSMADLDNAKIEDVIEFHRTFYRPDNATMVIVGDFAPAQAIGWAERFFASIPKPAQAVPRVTVKEPPQAAEKRISKWYGNNSPLPAVMEGYRIPARCTPDSYALNLASNILSNGESSRLFRQLVYEDQIAVQTAGFGNFTEHPNLFWAYAIMNPGKAAGDGEKAIDAQLEKMKTTPVSKQELEKVKNQVISQLILSRQTVKEKADAVGGRAVLCGDPTLINLELDRYLAVTAAEIQRVARKYFVPAQRTVLVIEPPKETK